jgi:exodeoxyribonuclease VII small subunit
LKKEIIIYRLVKMKAKKEPLFEENMKRLEEIVDILDRGEAPLATLLNNFEEGMKLAHSLREFLENAEQRVIDISRQNQSESPSLTIRDGIIGQDFEEDTNSEF